MRNQRRRLLLSQRRTGEIVTMVSGAGLALLGLYLSIPFVSYGGLCILGLGVVSVFWK